MIIFATKRNKQQTIMSTAVLPNGVSYYIPQTDLSFFKELAERMKWQIVEKVKKKSAKAEIEKSPWADYKLSKEIVNMTLNNRKEVSTNTENTLLEALEEKYR